VQVVPHVITILDPRWQEPAPTGVGAGGRGGGEGSEGTSEVWKEMSALTKGYAKFWGIRSACMTAAEWMKGPQWAVLKGLRTQDFTVSLRRGHTLFCENRRIATGRIWRQGLLLLFSLSDRIFCSC